MSIIEKLESRAFPLPFARICAPMVRYSKLSFRELVRQYSVDIAFTPMIVAADFIASKNARDVELTSNANDRPLVVQFAAKDSATFSQAAALVKDYCDMVDLNCGCPQKWAMQSGYGAALLKNIDLVEDMIKVTRRCVGCPVSVKVRIVTADRTDAVTDKEMQLTCDAARKLEKAGASVISIHGRTPYQSPSTPAHLDAIRLVREQVSIPVIANGGIYSLQDCWTMYETTKVHGIMSARGLLQNPCLFTGSMFTTFEAAKRYLSLAIEQGVTFAILHHHLIFMLENVLSRTERRHFNTLSSIAGIIDFFEERYHFSY